METKANHLVIGGFVLAMVGAVFGFVYWIENIMGGGTARQYHVLFSGSVQGLAEASGVMFNGLKVGTVKRLTITPEDTRKVRVLITVAGDTPIRENSRAMVSQQGLAGWVALEITPGTPDSPMLAAKAGQALPVIEAEPGGGAGSIMSAVPEALGNANALVLRLNDMVRENQEVIHRTAKNIEGFTAMLDQNKDDIAAVIKDARALSGRFTALADKLEGAVDKVAGGDDSMISQGQQAVTSFRKLAEKLDKTLGDQADGVTQQAKRSLREFEAFMKDGRRMADSLDRVLQKVENNPSSLIFGGSQVPEYKPRQQ